MEASIAQASHTLETISFRPCGVFVAGSAMAQTTVISTTLGSQDSGDTGLTERTLTTAPLSSANLGQVRFTFISAAGGSSCAHSSFGLSSGTGSNTTLTPVEITWSGASGPTLGANATLVSDWITTGLSWNTSTDKLVIICDITSSNAAFTTSAATGWAAAIGACGALSGVSWNVANVTGTCGNSTNANWAYDVTLIETRAAGGGCRRSLMGVGC